MKPLEWTDFFVDPDAKPTEAHSAERILAGFETVHQIITAENAARKGD